MNLWPLYAKKTVRPPDAQQEADRGSGELPAEKGKEKSGEDGGTNWNERAVRAAKDWLEHKAFSRKGLISRLEADGFTPDQAE